MKRFIAGTMALAMVIPAVGCGSKGSEPDIQIFEETEKHKTGTYTITSFDDLKFEQKKGAVKASDINKKIPDFCLYQYGDGFMGLANEKEKQMNKYAAIVPVEFGDKKFEVNMAFSEDKELNSWYIMPYETFSIKKESDINSAATEFTNLNKDLDKIYGERKINSESETSSKNSAQVYTTWEDGSYTFKSTFSYYTSGSSATAMISLSYDKNE